MKKTLTQEQKIQEVLSELTKIGTETTDKQIVNILNSIKKELSYLV